MVNLTVRKWLNAAGDSLRPLKVSRFGKGPSRRLGVKKKPRIIPGLLAQ